MIFNSFTYAVFLVVFFLLYWYLFDKSLRSQNLLIVVGSYLFYGWWDWRFLSLLIITTLSDFLSAIYIEDRPSFKKVILWWTLILNLGMLIFFKYSNFFIDSFFSLSVQNPPSGFHFMKIALPLGISFYTFQSIAYVVDVYRQEIKATRSLINYAAFISFFPQLVAGPIERASNLLPQIERKRIFNYPAAVEGCRLILWGLFKKVMIADNIAPSVDTLFSNQASLPYGFMWVGVFLFGVQIYCDFSGYSEIARGTARLLGIELMQNFDYPYFARDIHQFWRRWHISLSTWFKDYIFIPLGGSRVWIGYTVFNIFVVFFISGLWHGADTKFVAWGLYHFILYVLYMFIDKYFKSVKIPYFLSCTITLVFVMIGWVFFRSNDLTSALNSLGHLITWQASSINFNDWYSIVDLKIICGVVLLFTIEFLNRTASFGLSLSKIKIQYLRWMIYLILIIIMVAYGNFSEQKFIYFDF